MSKKLNRYDTRLAAEPGELVQYFLFSCLDCGKAIVLNSREDFFYKAHKTEAITIARSKGWRLRKAGWICDSCIKEAGAGVVKNAANNQK